MSTSSPAPGFVALWEFTAHAGHVEAFRHAYGAGGPWTALFRQSPEYRGTELGADPANSRRFVTIDRWTSRAAYEAFREEHRAAYLEIDRLCEAFTESERRLGEFDILG